MVLTREREALKAIQELDKKSILANRAAISRKMHVSKEYVAYLCQRLEEQDYIERLEERRPVTGDPSHGYRVTLQGYKLMPKAEDLLAHLASYS